MRFAFVAAEKAGFRVERLCKLLDVSKSGYYAWVRRPESKRAIADRVFGVLIEEAYERSRRTYGSPRIHAELRALGYSISQKRVARLMRSQGLRGRIHKKLYRPGVQSHEAAIAANILGRDFRPSAPNRSWAGDTTELRTSERGRIYLAVVIDLYSRFVVGWHISAVNDSRLVLAALEAALSRRAPPTGLLHHSDQGSPYASEAYQRTLERRGIVCSMSRRGNCYDNAVVESFFSTLKAELGEVFENAATAKYDVFDFIEVFYNRQRRHSSLGYRSPAEHEKLSVLAYQQPVHENG